MAGLRAGNSAGPTSPENRCTHIHQLTQVEMTGHPAGTTDRDTGYLGIVYNVFLEKTEGIGQVEDKRESVSPKIRFAGFME